MAKMTEEEKEALIDMFCKLAIMKNTYMGIITASQKGIEAVIQKAGVTRKEMMKLRKEGEQRARADITKGAIYEKTNAT